MTQVRRILLGACVLVALSCARRETTPLRDTLYRHLDGDPPTLDPTTTPDEIGVRVEELIFQSLVGLDRQRRFVPALARSWTISPDGLSYEFRLDPAARWQDGSPVTSADAAFTIDRVRDPKVPAVNWKWGFEDVAAVETPDESTLIVRFTRPYSERLFAFMIPILSRAAFPRTASPDRQPFGSGPYRLESWEPKQKLTLLRREGVSAETFPFRRVVFRIIPDGTVRFQAGARGDLDEFRISRDQRPAAERSADFSARNRILKAPQFSVVLLVWSLRNPVLADARVRRALALSWPRAQVARQLYPPDGARLISGPYPAGAPENAADVSVPGHDPAAAARLLDEAGLARGTDGFRRRKGRRVSLEILYPGAPMYANIAQILQESYGKVGIELVLRQVDWASYSERFTAGEFDLSPMNIEFLPPNLDPYPFYHSSQAPPRGQNSGFYRNAAADAAMEAARRELDVSRRLELYREIHRILAADPPADFFFSADQYWGISKAIEGVETSPSGLFHFLPGPLGWRPAPATAVTAR